MTDHADFFSPSNIQYSIHLSSSFCLFSWFFFKETTKPCVTQAVCDPEYCLMHTYRGTHTYTHTQCLSGSRWSSLCQSVNSWGFPNKSRQASLKKQDTRQLITFGYSSFGMSVLCWNVMFIREHQTVKKKKKKHRRSTKTWGHHVVDSGLILVLVEMVCYEMVCVVRGHWRLRGSQLIRTKLY